MAEKSFGVKEVNLIGASGTPSITSPNNLNLNANNVAISTNVSIGGTLSVTGNVSVGGTLTYEDVTNIDSVGVVTARSGLSVTGGTSFFAGAISAAGGITGTATTATNITVTANNTANETVYPLFSDGASGSQGAETDTNLTYNPSSNLLTAGSFSGSLAASNLTGTIADGRFPSTLPAISGANLTNLNGSNIASGTVADARISTLTASKLSGALPAISGANLTNLPEPDEAPVVDFTVTANGSSAYRFSGGGVDTSADDPDLYLIRGQKYRFNNTTGSAHPFQFRATTGGSAYTAGVSGDQNGVQFFTPDYDTPSKIYYICTLHSNMVGTIYIRGANGANENVGVTTFASSAALHTNRVLPVGGVASSGGTTYGGGIVQVIFAENNNVQTFSFNAGTFAPQTVCSVTITPKSNTSKILIHCSAGVYVENESAQNFEFSLHLKRGSTLIGGNTQSSHFRGTNVLFSGVNAPECATTGTFFYMDSPATTSAVTYNLCLQGGETRTYGVCANKSSGSTKYNFQNSAGTNITVMEISA